MRKIIWVQKLKGTKKKIFEKKPLEIYFIGESRFELLYPGIETRIYKSSGIYSNIEITEIKNIYGVRFIKETPVNL